MRNHDMTEMDTDDLAAARGILLGVLLSSVIWVVIGVAVIWLW